MPQPHLAKAALFTRPTTQITATCNLLTNLLTNLLPTSRLAYRHSYPYLTLTKVALFRADRPDEFMAELLSRVEIEQVPDWLGGSATGWAHGCGGPVPSGAGL